MFLFQVPLRPPTASSNASSTSRPSLALANKMKGFRKDMQQKISRLRSRSAERISKRLQTQQERADRRRSGHEVSSRSTSIGGMVENDDFDDSNDDTEDDR